MKMKLAQRLLLGYYKTKLKAIGLVSPRKAAEMAYRIFCTPYAGKTPRKIPPVFHKAEKVHVQLNELTIRGFRWIPEHPNGKKVLIAHGFSSNAYKFEKYILPLKKEGFEVLAFDAPAHGQSEGKLINAYIYRQALLQAEASFGPIYGFMGHSLGGLAASLAFEALPDNQDRKLVLVAPATETTRAIDNFFRMIPVAPNVKQAFTGLIDELTEHPISYYSVSRVVRSLHSPVLWIHDRQDTICPFEDVKPLLTQDLPHVRFQVTEGLGHSRVYKDNQICSGIVRFFAGNIS